MKLVKVLFFILFGFTLGFGVSRTIGADWFPPTEEGITAKEFVLSAEPESYDETPAVLNEPPITITTVPLTDELPAPEAGESVWEVEIGWNVRYQIGIPSQKLVVNAETANWMPQATKAWVQTNPYDFEIVTPGPNTSYTITIKGKPYEQAILKAIRIKYGKIEPPRKDIPMEYAGIVRSKRLYLIK